MMIELIQVSKRYADGLDALNGVNFSLAKGEMVFLTGHSGAGKSTLLKLMGLLEYPSTGEIILDGKRHRDLSKKMVLDFRSRMGIIFQSSQFLKDRSVFDNVALPLQIQGYPPHQITKRVQAALDKVGLIHQQKRLPIHLSGGELQRIGIARAVVHKPQILLADEPTGNLDPMLSAEVFELFRQFNQTGVSVVIATHDLALIARMKHRIIRLKGGRVC